MHSLGQIVLRGVLVAKQTHDLYMSACSLIFYKGDVDTYI